MLLRKPTDCSVSLATLLSVAFAAGQSTQPRRELDVPYVPTTVEAVTLMLKLADVKPGDVVYDLGCGDGRIVIAAAKDFGARGVGIDIDPDRIREAKENAKKTGVENRVRFEENDLFKADFHEASVVTLFLLNGVNLKLRPRLLTELKPGTGIVSNTFEMGDWKPEKKITVGGADDDDSFLSRKLYLWLVPPGIQIATALGVCSCWTVNNVSARPLRTRQTRRSVRRRLRGEDETVRRQGRVAGTAPSGEWIDNFRSPTTNQYGRRPKTSTSAAMVNPGV